MSKNYHRSQWDKESRVGAMTRTMTRDVKDSVKRKIESLYVDENGELGDGYRKGCAEWHWNVVAYSNDEDIMDTYTALLELFFKRKIDPRENEKWKQLMRRSFSKQFIKKINNLKTQVPIIAVMDDTIYEQPEESDWWEIEE